MALNLAMPSTWSCPSWPMTRDQSSYCPLRKQFSCSAARQNQDQIYENHSQVSSNQCRPVKRVRTGLNPRSPGSPPEVLEPHELFALPTGFPVPRIKVTTEEPTETLHSRNGGDVTASMRLDDTTSKAETSPYSYYDRWISFRRPEDHEFAVSPLEAPSGFLENFSKESNSIAKDSLEDTEMTTGEEPYKEPEAESGSYTLSRFLTYSEGPIRSQETSISRPDFPRSTGPDDIKKELQKLESDISDALQNMDISNDGIPESHLQSLEARFGSENLEGLEGNTAEDETDPQELLEEEEYDILDLEDGNEAIAASARAISPELESWISKSSLVGSILKPLVGSAFSSIGFPEEHVHSPVPQGQKRKASTC
ncbi:hypothetical protein TWF730_002119 [Orbilia blumenaviensis]|uniref:Uncharacterized protein n=1 Tax=Orbilia blumenaviensis TaxID=1796055 RepID=A0AAV9UD10_9PEZI